MHILIQVIAHKCHSRIKIVTLKLPFCTNKEPLLKGIFITKLPVEETQFAPAAHGNTPLESQLTVLDSHSPTVHCAATEGDKTNSNTTT